MLKARIRATVSANRAWPDTSARSTARILCHAPLVPRVASQDWHLFLTAQFVLPDTSPCQKDRQIALAAQRDTAARVLPRLEVSAVRGIILSLARTPAQFVRLAIAARLHQLHLFDAKRGIIRQLVQVSVCCVRPANFVRTNLLQVSPCRARMASILEVARRPVHRARRGITPSQALLTIALYQLPRAIALDVPPGTHASPMHCRWHVPEAHLPAAGSNFAQIVLLVTLRMRKAAAAVSHVQRAASALRPTRRRLSVGKVLSVQEQQPHARSVLTDFTRPKTIAAVCHARPGHFAFLTSFLRRVKADFIQKGGSKIAPSVRPVSIHIQKLRHVAYAQQDLFALASAMDKVVFSCHAKLDSFRRPGQAHVHLVRQGLTHGLMRLTARRAPRAAFVRQGWGQLNVLQGHRVSPIVPFAICAHLDSLLAQVARPLALHVLRGLFVGDLGRFNRPNALQAFSPMLVRRIARRVHRAPIQGAIHQVACRAQLARNVAPQLPIRYHVVPERLQM